MTRGYCRFPDVRGNEIVFVADDDLWTVSLDGGQAQRLTTFRQPVSNPRISPDGTRVAFGSMRHGAGDAYVLDRGTGDVQRLTFEATNTLVIGWDGDDVLVAMERDGHRNGHRIHRVAADGTLTLTGHGCGMALARHSSGAEALVTHNGRDSAWWKRYRGGMAAQLWLRPVDGEWKRPLPDEEAGCHSPGWCGDRLFFTNDAGNLADLPQAQLWSVNLDGEDLQQHTHHTEADGYVRDPRSDGPVVVFHCRGQLFRMDGLDAAPQPIDVKLPLGTPHTRVGASDVQDLDPDHAGNATLLEWRGVIGLLTHRQGPLRVLAEKAGVRHRLPRSLGASRDAVWVSDAGGVDALEVGSVDGSGEVRRIAEDMLGYVLHMQPNPAGDKVAVISHDGRVSLVGLDGSVAVLEKSDEGEVRNLTWSPDSRWLAWRMPVNERHARLQLCDTKDAALPVSDLTGGEFNDFSPSFSRCGRYLAFLSERTFDPHYDTHTFDLGFADAVRPYLLVLAADEPTPFGPSVDGWPIGEVQKSRQGLGEKNNGEDEAVECRVDLDGIHARVQPFPVPAGKYAGLRAVEGGITWLVKPSGGVLGAKSAGVDGEPERPSLSHYSFVGRKHQTIGEGLDSYRVSGDGRRIVVRDKDQWLVVPSDRKVDGQDDQRVTIDTRRVSRNVNLTDEWHQMFTENGRFMRDQYWREDMDGVNWDGVLELYRPLMDRVTTRNEVVDVMWETVGELNTSHAYVIPPMPEQTPESAGLLGARLSVADDGVVIDEVMRGVASNPQAWPPLLAPGVAAKAGERIVAVNGTPVRSLIELGTALQGSAGHTTELMLRNDDGERRVAVVPMATDSQLRYHAWVDSRAEYVRTHAAGCLGYLHIPDMGPHGWAQFHRDLDRAMEHEGVVVDVRFNGGGNTSQLIIERIRRRVLGWGTARHSSRHEPYPMNAALGPVVLVTNRYAGSDGDIVSAAFQGAGIGPVVGERSWGGVVGIDGRFQLVDGTKVTQPKYSSWFNTYGWGLENHGIDPDIVVNFGPEDWDAEADPQLDAAIAEALRRLEEKPADAAPPFPEPRIGS